MTVPQAILAGAVIIGASIVSARLVAPYELSSGTAVVWRLNTITGETKLCNYEFTVGDSMAALGCH